MSTSQFLTVLLAPVGLLIIGLSYKFKPFHLAKPRVSWSTCWLIVGGATVILFVRVLTVYWGNFQFVSWKDAYALRSSGSEIAQNSGLAYPTNWLSFVFLPLLMGLGLAFRKQWLFAIAVAGTILLYATQGMKHILFSGPYVWAMYLLLRRKQALFGLRLVWSVGAVGINLSRLEAGDEGVPVVVAAVGRWVQRDGARRAGVIDAVEEEQFQCGGVAGEDAEVDAAGEDGCAQRATGATGYGAGDGGLG